MNSDPAALARQSLAERLAQSAPINPADTGAVAGRAATSIAPVFNIHTMGNAEHTANEVQRRLQDTTNYLP